VEEESSSAIALQPELDAPRYGLVGVGGTDLGTRHDHNEDRWAVQQLADRGALLIVCDGMGGMGRGDLASSFALTRLVEVLGRGHEPPLQAAATAIRQVDRELVPALGDDGSGRQPGSTAAVVQVSQGVAHVSWVGDSSVMLVREGKVVAHTRPHRLVQDLIDQGVMTPEEARKSPMARFLARSLGGRAPTDAAVEPSSLVWRLAPNDAIVVCSDGLTDMLRHQEIADIVSRGGREETAVQALIQEALARKADDNVTVIVARCVHASVVGEEELLGPVWDLSTLPPEEDAPDDEADLPAAVPAAAPGPPAMRSPQRNPMVMFAVGLLGFSLVALAASALGAWFYLP
jgi:protein phosphatase